MASFISKVEEKIRAIMGLLFMNYEDIKLLGAFYKEFIFKSFAESPTVYINSKNTGRD